MAQAVTDLSVPIHGVDSFSGVVISLSGRHSNVCRSRLFNWGWGRDKKSKTNDTAPALLLFVGDSEAGGLVYLIDGFIQ